MSDLHVRRARRTDFTAVMRLLVEAGIPAPSPDRTSLRRFRQIVADLGGDFYLAVRDEDVVGLVHLTYTRQLAAPPRAQLDQLVVAPQARRSGVGRALLELACARARKRGCVALCGVAAADDAAQQMVHALGVQPIGQAVVAPLPPMA